jgi:hypothetical protein
MLCLIIPVNIPTLRRGITAGELVRVHHERPPARKLAAFHIVDQGGYVGVVSVALLEPGPLAVLNVSANVRPMVLVSLLKPYGSHFCPSQMASAS